MTSSELYYFICRCLAMEKDPGAASIVDAELTAGHISWEDLVWMASSNFVLPALYSAFKRNTLLHQLPLDLSEYLEEIYQLNLNRNRSILKQAHEIANLFHEAGIEPVFLKGVAYLLQDLYPETGDRVMTDIDILIHPDQIHEAANILYRNGYVHPQEFAGDDFSKHHHLPGFEKPGEVAMVELHHTALAGSYGKLLQNEDVFSNLTKINGLNASVLSLTDQIILSFVHDQLVDDDYRYRSVLIKGLYDFYRLSCLGMTVPASVSVPGYNKKYKSYCFLVAEAFNLPLQKNDTAGRAARKYKQQVDYLMDHPKLGSLHQLTVLYRIRIQVVLGTLITAPFSRSARLYFKKKAGSIPALKKYLRGLRNEL
jgi:Uncharacterised nucleotidyltransferase